MNQKIEEKQVTILFTNCRSVCNKRDELREYLSSLVTKPTLLSLTETWTNDTISNEELFIPGYHLKARQDRYDTIGGRGGGILVYVLEGISACVDRVEECKQVNESICVRLETKQGPIFIYSIYRSPNTTEENTKNLLTLLDSNSSTRSIFCGDFNFHIDWEKHSSDTASGRNFLECLEESFLHQFVDFPTRGTNTLDLILAQENTVRDVKSEGKLGDSDHDMISFRLNSKVISNNSVQYVPNYSRANFFSIKSELRERNWALDLQFMNVQQAWDHFTKTIKALLRQYVPMVHRRSRNRPVWSSPASRKAVTRKQQLWREYKQGKIDFDSYKVAERKAKLEIRMAKKNFEKLAASELNTNPRKFYAYLNTKNKNTAIGPLSDGRGNICHDPLVMANIFNRTFASVFEAGSNDNIHQAKVFGNDEQEELSDIVISKEIILKKLQCLKAHSAPGFDGIHPKLLKICSQEVSEPLTIIFQKSLNEGRLPTDWKCTNISPLFKKGSRESPENYRPINCLSVPGKLMEQVIKDQLLTHLETNKLITNAQHGFRPGRSVTTGLLQYWDNVTAANEDGLPFDVLMTDFQKAFDKVPFKKMLTKLESHGVKGKVLNWIEDWMNERFQRVVLNGYASDWLKVTSSVVQGSVLGPILFLVFINDLDEAIKNADSQTLVFKFADDTKLGRIVNSVDDSRAFQAAIDGLVDWCHEWGMSLHPQKCKMLHFGRTTQQTCYKIDDKPVETSNSERDLGVTISTDFKFTQHVKKITAKANAVLARIKRTVLYRDRNIFPKLFMTYVRPILESSIPVWNTSMRGDSMKIEKVQRRALKCIAGLADKTYEERLHACGMQTLEERRNKLDLVETYKVLNSNMEMKSNFHYVHNRHVRETRSSDQCLLVPPKCKTRARSEFFANRVVNNWNKLPFEVRNCQKLSNFKKLYDKY